MTTTAPRGPPAPLDVPRPHFTDKEPRMTPKTATAYPTSDQIRDHIQHTELSALDRDGRTIAGLSTVLENLTDERDAHEHPHLTQIMESCTNTGDWAPYRDALETLRDEETHRVRYNAMISDAFDALTQVRLRNKPTRQAATPAVLEYLNSILPSVIDAAAAFDPASIPATAEEAALRDGDAAQTWRDAKAIVDTYSTIRAEQFNAVAQVKPGPVGRELVCTVGQYRDALHLDQSWIFKRLGAAEDIAKRNASPAAQAFLTHEPANMVEPVTETGFPASKTTVAQRLAWLHAHADLAWWVPSIRQMDDMHTACDAALRWDRWGHDGFMGRPDRDGKPNADDPQIAIITRKPERSIAAKTTTPAPKHSAPRPKTHPGLRD